MKKLYFHAVGILWSNGLKYNSGALITLIAFLPETSKKILHKNRINIPTPTSKPPIFNYAAFCNCLSTHPIKYQIELLLKNQQSISAQDLGNKTSIVEQEIFKLFMNFFFEKFIS